MNIVESFPLTVGQVFQKYTRIPTDSWEIFYHYTTHTGLEGILRSGGLRATYRMRMNDTGEFEYARNVVYEALDEVGQYNTLPTVAHCLTTNTRKKLDKILNDTTEMSRAYCACLTVSSDHMKQWETYAESGNGFTIGFNLHEILNNQVPLVQIGKPFIFCAPVIYNEYDQRNFVWQLVEAGIRDLQTFATTCSQKPVELTELRDRITQEIVVSLLTLIDFIKASTYSSEREIRLILDLNDGTLNAHNIQHYERDNKSIPFIFMDLRCPITKRIPLVEIKIGPKASLANEKEFLEGLLDRFGYGSNYLNRPLITQSLIVMDDSF